MSWETLQLGKFLTLKRGYDLPSALRKEGDIPIVSSSGITGHHNTGKVEGPGVVTGRYGTLGKVFFINEDFWPLNTALYVKDFKGNDPRFAAYFLRNFLKGTNSDKAAVPGVNRNDLHAREICVTRDTQLQRSIASILSAYDDLIENNRRRIQLLEQAARLLYKEWFVHLRFPGHEHVKIIDGVPEGWERKQVKDILGKVKRPRKIKKSEFLEEGPIPCVDQSREFISGYTDNEEAVVNIGKPVIIFGDHTRILKFVDFPFACGADGTQLIISNDEMMSQEYLYFALDAIDLSNYFYARHFKFLKDQYFLRPPNMLLSEFTSTIRPMMCQIETLRNQDYSLTKAHELLLPRLMKGEVAV